MKINIECNDDAISLHSTPEGSPLHLGLSQTDSNYNVALPRKTPIENGDV